MLRPLDKAVERLATKQGHGREQECKTSLLRVQSGYVTGDLRESLHGDCDNRSNRLDTVRTKIDEAGSGAVV